jgi:hypothetical protein
MWTKLSALQKHIFVSCSGAPSKTLNILQSPKRAPNQSTPKSSHAISVLNTFDPKRWLQVRQISDAEALG